MTTKIAHIAIIGGGAAGCFAAIHVKRLLPEAKVSVWEAGRKALAKVAVTGGGRCNLTNSFRNAPSLERIYPRGSRLMKRLLHTFNHQDVMRWFEQHGVKLVVQDDDCVFPQSQDAMEIVHTLLNEMRDAGVALHTAHRVAALTKEETGSYRLRFAHNMQPDVVADAVLVTTGGSPKGAGLSILNALHVDIVPPVPSLYGLCVPHHPITTCSGLVVPNVSVSIRGAKHKAQGPLLLTHWGISGPAVLKLSSYAAPWLSERVFEAPIIVNWMGELRDEDTLHMLNDMALQHPQRQVAHVYPPHLGSKLWCILLHESGVQPTRRWAEMGAKGMRRLANTLTAHCLPAKGRNRHKEEFVTCGGVALSNIQPDTLECRAHAGLYFAGEVLDVDAITGGFNLQAAWSMGYVAAQNIAKKIRNQNSI